MGVSIEIARLVAEWRIRIDRIREILNPHLWEEKDWRDFCHLLATLVQRHGASWIIDPHVYWDLRWNIKGGGELICQIEHTPEEKTTLMVAQTGGFAAEAGSYTWLWAEFSPDGHFSRDPYWVEGSWREALIMLLMPYQQRAGFLLTGQTETPQSLLLQEGARINPDAAPRQIEG